jgi:hypothetical protein
MANHMPRNRADAGQAPQQPQANQNVGPLVDRTQRSPVFDYEIPDSDGLHQEVTRSFGSIRVISCKLLTPLEDKSAAQAGKGDMVVTAYELAKRTIVEVTNETGERFPIQIYGGSADELWGQLHPKIRSLIVQAYAENASPQEATKDSFLASRKIRA